jgi:hypothetical protein
MLGELSFGRRDICLKLLHLFFERRSLFFELRFAFFKSRSRSFESTESFFQLSDFGYSGGCCDSRLMCCLLRLLLALSEGL